MNILPSKSALLHMRFFFAFFLLPVFVFALSQAPQISVFNAVMVFISLHFFIYPASNGYNSYFDKDEGSIALLEKPPVTDVSLYNWSLLFDLIGFLLALLVSLEFAIATLIYGTLSKMYSHPSIRLKKYPLLSFLIVFIFQGGFIYWTSYAAIANKSLLSIWDEKAFIAGIICSCLIGASYPLTQVYQHEEDSKRGDKTLSLVLGINGSFIFSGLLFGVGLYLMYNYWTLLNQQLNFLLFLVFIIPVLFVFINWFIKVIRDKRLANFRNMSRMTMISGTAMLFYFLLILLLRFY